MDILVYVEIEKNTRVKYEYDFELKTLICDRILSTPFVFPFNYGFIPNTLSGDGDPIDAIIFTEEPLISGSYIRCRIIGALETSDDKGEDIKLILCPMPKVSPREKYINNINNLPEYFLKTTEYFYQHYKDLENKKVIIGNLIDKDQAIEKYNKSLLKYNEK
jgi:inorganic pyrophosphatase